MVPGDNHNGANGNGDLPPWVSYVRLGVGLLVALVIEGLWLAALVASKMGYIESLSVIEWGLGLGVSLYLVRGLQSYASVITGGTTEAAGKGSSNVLP